MNTRHSLDVIEVRTPCPANWDQMKGDGQTRFCQGCQKHVHNLSAMSSDEAERLVCRTAGRLCVRFERDTAGHVVTLDYGGATRPRWSWRVWTLAALAAALVTGSVQALLYGTRVVPRPGVVAGMMLPRTTQVAPGGGFAGNGSVVMGDLAMPIDPPPSRIPQPATQPAQ